MAPFAVTALVVGSSSLAEAQWTASVKTDPMTDIPRLVLTLSAASSSRGVIGQAVRTSLMVRCEKGDVEAAYFNLGVVFPDDAELQLRFDRAEALSESWERSSDGTSLFAPAPAHFFDQLMSAKRILVRYAGVSDNERTGDRAQSSPSSTGSASGSTPSCGGRGRRRISVTSFPTPKIARRVERIAASSAIATESPATRATAGTSWVDRRSLCAEPNRFLMVFFVAALSETPDASDVRDA